MIISRTQLNLYFLTGTIGFFLIFQPVSAGLNKWVDEKGNTHYGDRVPPTYLKKEHSLLNEQGVIIRTTDAAKTEEELSQEEKQQKIKQKINTKRLIAEKKQALHDRMLLDTFTTESDLTHAIEARVETVNSQIALAETLIKNYEHRLENVKLRIKTIKASGRKPPENLHKEINTIGVQMEKNFAYIEDKTNERTEILKTFEADVQRYRTLNKLKQKNLEETRKRKRKRKTEDTL